MTRSRMVRVAVALALLLLVPAFAARGETPIPPAPTQWVTDNASLLKGQTIEGLNARLHACENATGHQVLAYITRTTGGSPLEDWTVRAFEKWKVGRKGLDDGLVLFVFSQDRTVRIEVGYGLEPKVPDVLASRIIRDAIVPSLQAGNPDLALTRGIDQILVLVGCETATSGKAPSAGSTGSDQVTAVSLTPLQLVLIGLVLLGFLILAVRSPWLAFYLLVNIFGGRGGGFSGGDSFSGGGGRSGGGGASGRW